MRKIETKKPDKDHWIRTCLLPLIIGFSLVVANISMIIFKVIGWILLSFGIITGLLYIKTNKEKILKFLRKIYLIKEKD